MGNEGLGWDFPTENVSNAMSCHPDGHWNPVRGPHPNPSSSPSRPHLERMIWAISWKQFWPWEEQRNKHPNAGIEDVFFSFFWAIYYKSLT